MVWKYFLFKDLYIYLKDIQRKNIHAGDCAEKCNFNDFLKNHGKKARSIFSLLQTKL